MKKLVLVSVLGAAGLIGMGTNAMAATATGNFNVNITLTSKCEINSTNAATGAVITDLAMSYTSFQTAAATGATNFNVRCTNTLPFALSLDSASVTDGATGLAYTLALSSAAAHIVGPTASLPAQTGTGSNVQYYVHGDIASGQAGTSTTGTANNNRVLTVTY